MKLDTPLARTAKTYIKPVGWVLTVLGLGFVGHALMQADLSAAFSLIAIWQMVGMACIYAIALLMHGFAWTNVLNAHHEGMLNAHALMRVYARSTLTKYLPGNVFQYVSRHGDLANTGARQTDIAKANIYEIISNISAAIAMVGGGLLFATIFEPPKATVLAGLALLLFVVSIVLLALNPIAITRALRISLPYHFVFMLTLEGLSLYLFAQAFPTQPDILPFGIFSLSWLVGYLVIGAPGGLGVREAAYVAMLQPFADISTLAAIAVTLRLITILGDALFSTVTIVYTLRKQKA